MEPKNFWDWLADWADQTPRKEAAAMCLFFSLAIMAASIFLALVIIAFTYHWALSVAVAASPVFAFGAWPVAEYFNSQGTSE